MRRTLRGAAEGAALGITVAVVDGVCKFAMFEAIRGAVEPSPFPARDDTLGWLIHRGLAIAISATFVCAVGRGISGRLAGAVIGATVGAIPGCLLGCRLWEQMQASDGISTFDPLRESLWISCVGGIVGSVVGAIAHARLPARHTRSTAPSRGEV